MIAQDRPTKRLSLMIAAAVVLSLTLFASMHVHAGVNTSYSGINPDVSSKARAKYTDLKGRGRDTVTIMLYLIGTDLESQNGMATADLNEILYSQMSNKNINLYVQTGGCRRWKNSAMTAGKVQRWKMSGNGLQLQSTLNSTAMTQASALSDFIQYCSKTSPANRYFLILWDHGAGSVTGYGYDELYPNDSMDVSEISQALEYGGVQFDFIGFDACLMATLETAIAIEPYADYMIASEESEPGTGWYYTNWLKLLDDNTSTNTLSLGRQIIDDFTAASSQITYNSQTTLSLVDLAELHGTVMKQLGDFGRELTDQLKGNEFQSVAIARNDSREFASSQRLDQVDLVDFCSRIGTTQAKKLADAIQSAVKYNKVSRITDAYGLSVYFPNSSLKSINSMLQLYDSIGMDEEWSESVRTYATLESSGQIAASSGNAFGGNSGSLIDILLGGVGGSGSGSVSNSGSGSSSHSAYSDLFSGSTDLSSLFGGSSDLFGGSGGLFGGNSYDSYSSMGVEDIYNLITGGSSYSTGYTGQSSSGSSAGSSYGDDLLSQLFGQTVDGYTTTSGTNYGGLSLSSLLGGYDMDSYGSNGYSSTSSSSGAGDLLSLAAEMLFGRAMVGSEKLQLVEKDGEQVLILPEEKWEQVTAAELNVFVDDGEGYLDLGLDNVAEYNDDGDLIDTWDGTWITLEGQPAAIYPISDEDEDDNGLYITRKFIPALLNGERVNLIVEFNEETGEDMVLGAQVVTETGAVGKGYREMDEGDVIVLICDYYSYDGLFTAQYTLGDPIIVPEDGVLELANMQIKGGEDDRLLYTYRLTDIYQAHYWLPLAEN